MNGWSRNNIQIDVSSGTNSGTAVQPDTIIWYCRLLSHRLLLYSLWQITALISLAHKLTEWANMWAHIGPFHLTLEFYMSLNTVWAAEGNQADASWFPVAGSVLVFSNLSCLSNVHLWLTVMHLLLSGLLSLKPIRHFSRELQASIQIKSIFSRVSPAL